jgi:hypothetical protein
MNIRSAEMNAVDRNEKCVIKRITMILLAKNTGLVLKNRKQVNCNEE